ncbi:MAG: SDR family oxidoreductase, partial [Candidatus Aminicenantes bacterium]|nr:SDR family oxidoreductase [Candidatus Aminicenantes bacterium]
MLKEKVTIITGAAGGIGSAAAKLFAEHGAILVLTDIRKKELEELEDTLKDSGAETKIVEHDVTDPSSWRSLIEIVRQKYGKIDILVNNAGVVHPGAAEKLAIDKVLQ